MVASRTASCVCADRSPDPRGLGGDCSERRPGFEQRDVRGLVDTELVDHPRVVQTDRLRELEVVQHGRERNNLYDRGTEPNAHARTLLERSGTRSRRLPKPCHDPGTRWHVAVFVIGREVWADTGRADRRLRT